MFGVLEMLYVMAFNAEKLAFKTYFSLDEFSFEFCTQCSEPHSYAYNK